LMDFNVSCYLFYEYSVKSELILKEESRLTNTRGQARGVA